ncbi:hypothetical protein JTB14_000303 [Gonioctena quinquepunctata]|nr:hypothetical protein JTB14_000303 [Gonioctena quinquepunctata]
MVKGVKTTKDPEPEASLKLFRASARRGAVKPVGLGKQDGSVLLSAHACENSTEIFADSEEEEDDVDENEDLRRAKLLAHEVEEDNEDEERNLQEDTDQ